MVLAAESGWYRHLSPDAFFSRDTWLYSTNYTAISNHSLFDIIRNVACEYPKVLIYILYRSRLKTVSRPVGGAKQHLRWNCWVLPWSCLTLWENLGITGLMQLEEGIPMDSNGFKPSLNHLFHYAFPAFSIFHSSSMKYYDIYLSYCARVQRVLKASSSLRFVSMPSCFPGLRWCSENLGSGSPHLFGAWIRRRLLQLGQSRREFVMSRDIPKWVDLHQYWVSQDSKVNRCELDIHRIPHISTILGTQRKHIQTCPSAKPLSFAVALIFKGHFFPLSQGWWSSGWSVEGNRCGPAPCGCQCPLCFGAQDSAQRVPSEGSACNVLCVVPQYHYSYACGTFLAKGGMSVGQSVWFYMVLLCFTSSLTTYTRRSYAETLQRIWCYLSTRIST